MTSLETMLRENGLTCRVETRERLAIIVPERGSTLPARAEILRSAREAGFTHVAVELDPDGAALSRG